MTEEQLDSLRFKLGGDWYDTWWLTIDERFDPMPLGFDEPTFFDLINKGWLEMYGESKCTLNHFHNRYITPSPFFNVLRSDQTKRSSVLRPDLRQTI